MSDKLRGVIAAIATAVDEEGEPDCTRSAALARFLLANGCDALNVLGTTGEANSLGLAERMAVLEGLVSRGIPAARVLQGLLSLSKKYETEQIDRACDTAWRSQAFNYRVIKRLLENQTAARQQTMTFMDDHPIIRSVSEYSEFVRNAIQGE